MKVLIKKTGEIVNAASYAKVELDMCNSYGDPIDLPLDEIELVPDGMPLSSEIDILKEIISHQQNTIGNLAVQLSQHGSRLAKLEKEVDAMIIKISKQI